MTCDIQIERMCDRVEAIFVYNAGEVVRYGQEDPKFKKICAVWQGMLAVSHQMPAFGVSLHDETSNAIRDGVWVEFAFDGQYSTDGMPYEKLLVNVVQSATGFNLIRYNSDRGYEGRCFYFDLIDHDMSDFYNCIVE